MTGSRYSSVLVAGALVAGLGSDLQAQPAYRTQPLDLVVALVEDPDFPPLDERLVQRALQSARTEYARRFDVDPPTIEVRYRFDVRRFLEIYARPDDPRCKEDFDARYKGTGVGELAAHRDAALKFFRQWPLESLRGFVPEPERKQVKTYEGVYNHYAKHYVAQIDLLETLKTPAGTPLLDPAKSSDRSFVAWLCALERQNDFDVVITNTFIVSDILTEPHPHAVFGKAKVGGVATRSPQRTALGGEALLATTFSIDTTIPELSEIAGSKASFEQRARLLGAYLLAHEIAHATFGIPDVYDHPKGCLMTSRPGATYLDGLVELDAHPTPCPRCRPYVRARSLYDEGVIALDAKDYRRAARLFLSSVKQTPKHFHGSRRGRLAKVTMAAAKAQKALGRGQRALRYAKLAVQLDPRSNAAKVYLDGLESMPLRDVGELMTVSRTASTSTAAQP